MSPNEQPAPTTLSIPLLDASQVGEARRTIGTICGNLGFSETDAGRAGILVTEAGNNLVRHAGGGELLVQPLLEPDHGLEIVALDRGPGIADLDKAFADGQSTAGTPGTGLGAMRRLSSRFDAYSQPKLGTAMLMQIRISERPRLPIESGGVSLPKPGEDQCGDAWRVGESDRGYRVVLADGLGHGPLARDAARVAVTAIDGSRPERALESAHLAARATRGAALAVAEIELASGTLRYAGIGNIAGVLLGNDRARSLVSMNGTIGQGLIKPREFLYEFSPGALLVMSSDGLASRWSADPYPGLLLRHPTLVAAVLYRDHARRTDDATVVVTRLGMAS